jgi:hypothetical protein
MERISAKPVSARFHRPTRARDAVLFSCKTNTDTIIRQILICNIA